MYSRQLDRGVQGLQKEVLTAQDINKGCLNAVPLTNLRYTPTRANSQNPNSVHESGDLGRVQAFSWCQDIRICEDGPFCPFSG